MIVEGIVGLASWAAGSPLPQVLKTIVWSALLLLVAFVLIVAPFRVWQDERQLARQMKEKLDAKKPQELLGIASLLERAGDQADVRKSNVGDQARLAGYCIEDALRLRAFDNNRQLKHAIQLAIEQKTDVLQYAWAASGDTPFEVEEVPGNPTDAQVEIACIRIATIIRESVAEEENSLRSQTSQD